MRGTEELMRPKAHGSTAAPVQATLRWGVDCAVADFICSHNRDGAEPSLAFACQPLTEELSAGEPVTLILTLTTLALPLPLTLTLTRLSSMTASAGRLSSWPRRLPLHLTPTLTPTPTLTLTLTPTPTLPLPLPLTLTLTLTR